MAAQRTIDSSVEALSPVAAAVEASTTATQLVPDPQTASSTETGNDGCTENPIVTDKVRSIDVDASASKVAGNNNAVPFIQQHLQCTREGDASYEWFDVLLFMKICGSSALLHFLQVVIPLGTDGRINPVAFLCYQMLYSTWGSVLIRLPYSIALPAIPAILNWLALAGNMCSQFAVNLAFVFSVSGTSEILNLTRGVGLSVQAVISLIGLLIFGAAQDYNFAQRRGETIHWQRFERNDGAAGGKPSLDVAGGRTRTSTTSSARKSDTTPRRSSFARLIDLTASLDSAALQQQFGASDIGRQVVTFSCAARTSIWRNFTPAVARQQYPNNAPGYNLKVLQLTALSIVMMDNILVEEMQFKIIGSALHQALRVVVRDASKYALFLFCEWLTVENEKLRGGFGDVGYYLLFLFGITLLRMWFQVIGLWIDMYKTGGPSEQHLLDMWISTYYFVFYRGLFISVQSYEVFICIKLLHIAQELFSYQLRYSDIYAYCFHEAYRRVQDMDASVLKSIATIVLGPPLRVHVQRTDITLGFRLYLIIYTCTSFIATFSFLRYGYNRSFYCLFRKVEEAQYQRLMIFTAASLVLEVVLFAYINSFSRRVRGCSALSAWQRFLSGQLQSPWRIAVVLFIASTAMAIINFNLAQLNLSTLGNHRIHC